MTDSLNSLYHKAVLNCQIILMDYKVEKPRSMIQTHRLCVEIYMHYYVHYNAKEENPLFACRISKPCMHLSSHMGYHLQTVMLLLVLGIKLAILSTNCDTDLPCYALSCSIE